MHDNCVFHFLIIAVFYTLGSFFAKKIKCYLLHSIAGRHIQKKIMYFLRSWPPDPKSHSVKKVIYLSILYTLYIYIFFYSGLFVLKFVHFLLAHNLIWKYFSSSSIWNYIHTQHTHTYIYIRNFLSCVSKYLGWNQDVTEDYFNKLFFNYSK